MGCARILIHMRCALALILMSFTARVIFAQEAVPLEDAQKAARKVTEIAVSDPPFKMEPDVDQSSAIKADKGGLLIVPDKHFGGAQHERIKSVSHCPPRKRARLELPRSLLRTESPLYSRSLLDRGMCQTIAAVAAHCF